MAGVYIHIPYCKQKCAYCDFHFSTSKTGRQRMLDCLCSEIVSRHNEIEHVNTIYFGGGTPSILSASDIARMLDTIRSRFVCRDEIEITLEANPDDINPALLRSWKNIGINRLSIGIQTFDDRALVHMNRAHDSKMALNAVIEAKKAGINNLSVDMIHGLAGQNMKNLQHDIDQFMALDVDHISSYNLTIEKGTLYHKLEQKGTLNLPDEEESADMMQAMIERLESEGYEQYEVSNFARDGKYSIHNTSYWKRTPFIGIGPSAHSLIRQGGEETRSWNVSNNQLYMKGIENDERMLQEEPIKWVDQVNERILTGLRMKEGIDLKELESSTGHVLLNESKQTILRYKEFFEENDEKLALNKRGILLADRIASDLFVLE